MFVPSFYADSSSSETSNNSATLIISLDHRVASLLTCLVDATGHHTVIAWFRCSSSRLARLRDATESTLQLAYLFVDGH